MSPNHSEIIKKYSRQLRRTLLCDIAINTAYGFVGILLVPINFLNELVGRQILNPNQENKAMGLLFVTTLAITASFINSNIRLNQARKIAGLQDKLINRMTMPNNKRK